MASTRDETVVTLPALVIPKVSYARNMLRLIRLLALIAILLPSGIARAQDVTYSAVDRATVRVIALGVAEMVSIEHRGDTYRIGVPIGGHGSGTIVTPDGLILTAAHVVSGARQLAVHLPGNKDPIPAKLIYSNDELDYAFIRVSGTFTDVAQLAPADTALKVRDTIFAIGYPLDASRADPQSSRGSISGRMPDGNLQLDIAVNPGNSGGPVIDDRELVKGVVVARSNVEEGAVGLALAVPVAVVRPKFDELSGAGPGDLTELTATGADRIADMVSTLGREGPEWFKGSLEASDSQTALNQRVRKMAEDLPASADAQMLASVYFWNRYMVRVGNREDPGTLHQRAIAYSEAAIKADPSLREDSTFVQHVLGEGRTEMRPRGSGSRPKVHDGFFLRGNYGVGYMSLSGAESTGSSASGLVLPWQVLIGGGTNIVSGVVLSGFSGSLGLSTQVTTGGMPGTGAGATTTEVEVDADASGLAFGGFLQLYPDREKGLHFQAQLAWSTLEVVSDGSSINVDGYALSAGAGYELFFANQWSAGLVADLRYLTMDETTTWMPTVSAALTWH